MGRLTLDLPEELTLFAREPRAEPRTETRGEGRDRSVGGPVLVQDERDADERPTVGGYGPATEPAAEEPRVVRWHECWAED